MFVVHYAEIGIKGKNRVMFERKLEDNIRQVLKGTVKRFSGRMVVETKDRKAEEKLARVFGISNFSPAVSCRPDLKSMSREAVEILKREKGSFKVQARRDWKAFPLNSMEINRDVGAEVVKELGLKVEMRGQDTTLYIEVLKDMAIMYTKVLKGPGGLPVGVSGKAVCLLSGGIDSPVAAWKMMKRGCEVIFVHFWNEAMGGQGKMGEMVKAMRKWQPKARIVTVPFRDIQNEIIAKVPADWRMIIYRRYMFRLAEKLALKEGAKALVTGESLGQVASQTLDNMTVIEEAVDMPVLRPLVGMDKQEIVDLAQEIGTFEISVKPYQDCCTFMVPKHPVTRGRLKDAKRLEEGLEIKL